MVIANPLPALSEGAPVFETGWPVRLADVDADQRLRLDSAARYLQDIGYEHLEVAEEGDDHQGWVVRRTVFDVLRPIVFGERVDLKRWCSETSNRWCNMRVQIKGSRGGLIETVGFLIHFGVESGVPTRMSEAFLAPMLASTTEHRLRWKAALTDALPGADAPDVVVTPFPLRFTDIDHLGHVNNAVALHGIEEVLSAHQDLTAGPYRAIIEYGKPLMGGDKVTIRARRNGQVLDIWFVAEGESRAVARISPL